MPALRTAQPQPPRLPQSISPETDQPGNPARVAHFTRAIPLHQRSAGWAWGTHSMCAGCQLGSAADLGAIDCSGTPSTSVHCAPRTRVGGLLLATVPQRATAACRLLAATLCPAYDGLCVRPCVLALPL